MTCAHVVADAVGIQRDDINPPAQPISVDFPLVDDNKKCTARVVMLLPSRDGTDDIAVLELSESAPSSAKPANLVIVDNLWGAEFGVCGFPSHNPKGVWAKGKVSGLIEGKRIQIDALEGSNTYSIERGFSGSPVYSSDPNINGVIGMAVSAESDPNIKAAFMIPSEVLLTKMNQRQTFSQLTDDKQTPPLRTPINMTDGKPQPVPHIWERKMQRPVVYIGKFQEMQTVRKSNTVFVAHHFFGGDTNEIEDYRGFLKEGLAQIGYLPLFARDDSGTLLETICQDIINAEVGIYDVSGYNANVLIELGMSIGLNQPTIVIAQDDKKPLIHPLEQLNPLRYKDHYDLTERIGQALKEHIQTYRESGINPRFCAACGLDCIARKPRQSPEDEYLLIGADPEKDKAIFFHLNKAVKNFNLVWQELEGDFNLTVCRWVAEIKRSKIVFFHSKEGDTRHSGSDNASTMVRTGIAIGLGVAWRMILKHGERMPTDLEGYKYVTWQSRATAFDATLGSAVRALLNEVRPYGGMYEPLIPVEVVENTDENGLIIQEVSSEVVQDLPTSSKKLMSEHDTLFTAQHFLYHLDELNSRNETKNMVAIGMSVAQEMIVPPELANPQLSTILWLWNDLFHLQHQDGTNMLGYVKTEQLGETHYRTTHDHLYPDDFVYGLAYGLARRFLPSGTSFQVKYVEDKPRKDYGGDITVIDVMW